jgi:16S rRNA processing protein RimM
MGEVALTLYDLFPRDPKREEPLFVEIDGHAVPLFLDSFVRRGVRGATAVFADIDTPARANELVGRPLYMRAGQSAGITEDEIYFDDLVGWEAEMREAGETDGAAGAGGDTETVGAAGAVGAVGASTTGNTAKRGVKVGRITAFFESEFNPLLEIAIAGETELIPAVEDFIVEVDESRRRVILSIPEGLLGLNRP